MSCTRTCRRSRPPIWKAASRWRTRPSRPHCVVREKRWAGRGRCLPCVITNRTTIRLPIGSRKAALSVSGCLRPHGSSRSWYGKPARPPWRIRTSRSTRAARAFCWRTRLRPRLRMERYTTKTWPCRGSCSQSKHGNTTQANCSAATMSRAARWRCTRLPSYRNIRTGA